MLKFRKVISVVLAVLMTLSVFSVVTFASANSNSETNALSLGGFVGGNDERVATIILPGIGQSESTYTKEDGSKVSGGLILIDSDGLVGKILKNLALPLLTSIFTQSVDSNLADSVYAVVKDLFYIQSSDKEGNALNNLELTTYPYPLSQYSEDDHSWFYRMFPMEPVVEMMNTKYNATSENYNAEDYFYLYTFQLISDPKVAAEGLVDFIDMVKEQAGVEKVNIVPLSLGGTVLTSYLELIQEEYNGDFSNINKIVNVVACLNGTDLFSDFYAREWNLKDEFLYDEYIDLIVEANGMDAYMGSLIKIALKLIPKEVLYTILTAAMDSMLDNMLVNCPQLWAMVTKERYEELADQYLVGSDYAVLRAKTDWFQNARMNLNSNLLYVKENYNVTTYSVTGYGLQFTDGEYNFFGITGSSETTNSDGIINIGSASLGATCAPAGEKVTATDTSILSPDGELDISTCLFPNTTWFFKNQHHEVGRNDVVIKLLGNILVGNVTDVNSSANFPQFNYGRVTKNLTRSGRLLDQAEEVIANEENKYTQEQIDTVKPVYEKALKMLDNTVLNENSAKEAENMVTELNDALACTGLTKVSSGLSFSTKALNAIFGAAEKVICK